MLCTEKKIRVHAIFLNTGTGCSGFQIPAEVNNDFSPLQNAQTGSGAHPTSYSIGNGGFSLG
jgi:hypothetical protein